MDLLYQRYASPFSFMDGMIQTRRFFEFVIDFIKTTNKEKEETMHWEFYLHRVFDKTYTEFKEAIKVEQDNKNMTESDIETTINISRNILANFNPEKGGG